MRNISLSRTLFYGLSENKIFLTTTTRLCCIWQWLKKDIRGEYNEELLNSKFTVGLNVEESILDSRRQHGFCKASSSTLHIHSLLQPADI